MKGQTDNIDRLIRERAEIDGQLRQHKTELTVLFTDVVGSTSYFDRYGDTAGLLFIHRHAELASKIVSEHQGRVIKTIGDSVMAEFPNPASAVYAAIQIQQQTFSSNREVAPRDSLFLRIGINSGSGFRYGVDVYGDVVNVAARIAKAAGPAQILVSQAVLQAFGSASTVHFNSVGPITFHGKNEKENVSEVVWLGQEAYDALRQSLTPPPPSEGRPPEPDASRAVRPTPSARYEILGEVGRGGMGVVHRALDRATNETVALKLLRPEIASDENAVARLVNELKISRKVTHKNVCRIYDLNRLGESTVISMELVSGESLRKVLDRFGALGARKGLDIALQVCAGLREAHLQGVIHRDLKPENVMIDESGNVKVMDFGIAQSTAIDAATDGSVIGTPAYMSPEQAQGKAADQRSDIYSLGLVLYEIFTGKPAFAGESPFAQLRQRQTETPVRPRGIDPLIPDAIEAAIVRCMAINPDDRFQSIDELQAALTAVSVVADTTGRRQPVALDSRAVKGRWQRAAWLGLVAMVLAAAWFGFLRSRPRAETDEIERASPKSQSLTVAPEPVAPVPSTPDPQAPASPALTPDVKSTPPPRPPAVPARNAIPEFEFVKIAPGEFMMGCSSGDSQCFPAEMPAHLVRITTVFEIGKYEVTQAQWESVMGFNPSAATGADFPVERVSWNDVVEFLSRLNEGRDGYRYRLPTEAEWEYAARAGTTGAYAGTLEAMAWFEGNSEKKTHRIGQMGPNAWGLHDMRGNVWEWVKDWYDDSYYQSGPSSDPPGPASGQKRLIRGGAWDTDARNTRVSCRGLIDPGKYSDVGFRFVRERMP